MVNICDNDIFVRLTLQREEICMCCEHVRVLSCRELIWISIFDRFWCIFQPRCSIRSLPFVSSEWDSATAIDQLQISASKLWYLFHISPFKYRRWATNSNLMKIQNHECKTLMFFLILHQINVTKSLALNTFAFNNISPHKWHDYWLLPFSWLN